MKKIFVLFAVLVFVIAGCTRIGGDPKLPIGPPKNDAIYTGSVSFVELSNDVESCLEFYSIEGEQIKPAKLENVQDGTIVAHPAGSTFIDTPACYQFKQYEDKFIVGRLIPLRNGCEEFGGIEIEKDDQAKKIIVNFIRSTAPEGIMCTMIYGEIPKWVAVDYVDGYNYEAKIKDIVKILNSTEISRKEIYTTSELKKLYPSSINQTFKLTGNVAFVHPCYCPIGALCNGCRPFFVLTDGITNLTIDFDTFFSTNDSLSASSYVESLSVNDTVTLDILVWNQDAYILPNRERASEQVKRFYDAGCTGEGNEINCENANFVKDFNCMEPQFMKIRNEEYRPGPISLLVECKIEGQRPYLGMALEPHFGCDGGFLSRCITYVKATDTGFVHIKTSQDLANLVKPIEDWREALEFSLLSVQRSHKNLKFENQSFTSTYDRTENSFNITYMSQAVLLVVSMELNIIGLITI